MLDRASTWRRFAIFVMTAGVMFGALAIGQGKQGVTLALGAISTVEFVADRSITVVDEAATDDARQVAREAVDPVLRTDGSVEGEVRSRISEVLDEVEAIVIDSPPVISVAPLPDEPDPTTTTSSSTTAPDVDTSTTTTTTIPVEPPTASVTGQVFLDVGEESDLVFDEGIDVALVGIDVTVVGADGFWTTVSSGADGSFTADDVMVDGPVIVAIDLEDPGLPESLVISSANQRQDLEGAGTDLASEPFVFRANVVPAEAAQANLLGAYPDLDLATAATLVDVAQEDIVRIARGRSPQLSQIEARALDAAGDALEGGIEESEVPAVRAQIRQSATTRLVIIDGQPDEAASAAAADLAGVFLMANRVEDEALFLDQQDAAAELVPDVEVEYSPGELIVGIGEEITQPALAAIDGLDLNRPDPVGYGALAVLSAVLVAMIFAYLARFRPGFWASDRRVSLLGLILVLAALAIRGVELASGAFGDYSDVVGYALPAAGFGFMISIVFDARIAVLAALALGTMAGVVFGDAGFVIYGALSTVAPVPVVSAISNNADQRRAIVMTGLASAVIAFATAWFFVTPETAAEAFSSRVLVATALAALMGWVSSIIGIFLVEILQGIFDVTTSLRLLELVDRNHRALQVLQEEAWGTFNHSLMVGTLADRAARSIGVYFIENQFGVTNPHDQLTPEESAGIIRSHVTDGMRLARKYGLPSEVAEGILSHHGDGIMRYFYETARERFGDENVNVEDFRHIGHKPRSQEMAILMMADALEGATRAIFTDEDPTPDRIAEVVEQIVSEKVRDGQLSESALTLGQLTTVKASFTEALVGHYHHRIPYPNFPEAHDAGPAIEAGAVPVAAEQVEEVEGTVE
jgi:putative nucleotidyltransferase with HDIG domain